MNNLVSLNNNIGHASRTRHNKRVSLIFDEKTVFRVIIKVTEKLVTIR